MLLMRTIISTIALLTLLIISTVCLAQVHQWTLVNGKACLQSVILVPERDAAYLYKQANRWLVNTFKNPEDILKARIESEYLRGEAYHSNVFKSGALNPVDFQYTFTLDVKDGKVRLTFSHGLLFHDVLYDNGQDHNGVYPIELYMENVNKRKKDQHSEDLLASVNTLSTSLLKSLETFLVSEYAKKDDW